MPQPNRILAIVYQSANNVLVPSTLAFAEGLSALGYQTEVLDLQHQDNFRRLSEALQSGDVAFAFGLQGVGAQLHAGERNLWQAARTPFIGMFYDHPSYCIGNHIADSPYVANVYHYPSMKAIFDKFIVPLRPFPRLSTCIRPNCFPVSDAPDNFQERPIKLLYMKTGVSLRDYEEHFNSLPQPLRDAVWDRIRQAEGNPNLSLCELASSLFDPATFLTPDVQVEFWAIVKGMDLYLRSKRALQMVEWLKMQDGAMIIGDGWDHVEKGKARATFKSSIDAMEANTLYAQTKFMCNTNPYAEDLVHERVILGLLNRCAVITDTNRWHDQHMGDIPNLLRIDWTGAIESQLAHALGQDEEFFAQNGQTSREKTATLFNRPDNPRAVADFAMEVKKLAGQMC